jgi:hypothetical protein
VDLVGQGLDSVTTNDNWDWHPDDHDQRSDWAPALGPCPTSGRQRRCWPPGVRSGRDQAQATRRPREGREATQGSQQECRWGGR